ncbi:cysteine-rich receptor-like protein kinase 3 isoform X2 [Lotus japonicus]|uniref:cysteine-rich receptor-like protein kinase 3 isoform X2 n=1 Tax=Lotus japonicus TaxID=34305 RepID=UPI00258FF15B|nr:cysteine-rich receptor-like protein kinase 3 isoform X2 [Lotus japonicus]
MASSSSTIFLLLILCFFTSPVLCETLDNQTTTKLCTNRTASPTTLQTFIANFRAAMDALTPLITSQRYGAVVNGSTQNQNATVYAFGECMKDLSQSDCNACFSQCKIQVVGCLPFQKGIRGGRLFCDGCYLRYDDYSFFGESLGEQDTAVCGASDFGGNDSAVFEANAMDLVRNLSVLAPENDGFFVGVVDRRNVSVYGLAQCWEFVNGTACKQCLADAVTRIDSCAGKEEGRALNSGCFMRYSTKKFYNNSTSGDASAGNHVVFFTRRNLMLRRRERTQIRKLGAHLDAINKAKLNVPYEILEKATDYFNDANKLGEGGSGSVYKGVMPDGSTVAIKRLSFNTTQWADHFFTEVNLIRGIDHKNLVKLLGCSITGPESLLVYEYVPNQSLLDHFSGIRISQPLTWEVRHKIILGIAEGLAYLHEESYVRIIHRDIKLSNILLEDDFTPKIADFGLARLFPEDKSHIITVIAGTLGYMAPEYVVSGKLTEKADVYSFGVLLVEVVSGKRISFYDLNSSSILQTVWRLYGSNRLSDIVDPVLEGNFLADDACRLLQIGLLCAQASAALRPSMSEVVKMISENHEIPQPRQPPFINSTNSELSTPSLPGNIFHPASSNTQSSGDTTTENLL